MDRRIEKSDRYFCELEGVDVSGDRRYCTLNFCQKEEDCTKVNEVLWDMQKVIFRYEGFLRQFLVDDKGEYITVFVVIVAGCTLIVVFGAPIAHADDAIRAVAAALSIQYQVILRNPTF